MHPDEHRAGRPPAPPAARPGSVRGAGAALALVTAGVAMLLLGPVSPASAHASLVGTAPGDGVTLRDAPDEITLSFSEHVVLDATRIEVVDGHGMTVSVTDLHLVTEHPDDMEEPVQVVGRLPHLASGTYRVSWRTLSGDDLHKSSGRFAFGLRRPVQAIGVGDDPTPPTMEPPVRWALLLGIALALGGLLAHSVLLRGGGEIRTAERALKLSVAGSLTALLASGVLLLAQVTSGGVADHELLAGSYGIRWGLREAGLALMALAAMALLRGARPGVSRALVLGGGTLSCLGTALLGHAGAGVPVSTTRVLATAFHLGAGLTWAGAVVCLALVLATRTDPSQEVTWAAALRSFGVPAAACVSLVVVSGLYLSSHVVASVDAVLTTFYGRTLLVKVGLVSLAGLVGLVNHRRVRGHGAGPLRRTLAVEAVVLMTVVAATAVLTSAQPAMGPESAHPDQAAHLDALLTTLALALAAALAGAWLVAVRGRRRALPETPAHLFEDSPDKVPT